MDSFFSRLRTGFMIFLFIFGSLNQSYGYEIQVDGKELNEILNGRVFKIWSTVWYFRKDGYLLSSGGTDETKERWKICGNEICYGTRFELPTSARIKVLRDHIYPSGSIAIFSSEPKNRFLLDLKGEGDDVYLDSIDTVRAELLKEPHLLKPLAKEYMIKARNDYAIIRNKRIQAETALKLQDEGKPYNVLLDSYRKYIYVKKCFADRKEYAQIYISEPELDRAKSSAHNIEMALKAKEKSLDSDAIWSEANKSSNPIDQADLKEMTKLYSNPYYAKDSNFTAFDIVRQRCQGALKFLEATSNSLDPSRLQVKKDF